MQSRLPHDQHAQQDTGHTMSSARSVAIRQGTLRTRRQYLQTQLDTQHIARLRILTLTNILCTQSWLGLEFSH